MSKVLYILRFCSSACVSKWFLILPRMLFCQLSENMPELVALQVERTLMIVTARDRAVAGGGEKKREPWSSFAALWSVETTVCGDVDVSGG